MNELNAAQEAALKAGIFIKSRLGKLKQIRYKGAINIVTDVDEGAEDLIVRHLRKYFPGYAVLAEEKEYEKQGEAKWVIDPLDGTTNFARGFPFFGVSIALERNNEIVMGVVYDPVHDELFKAQKGMGAFLNKKRISVSKTKNLSKAFLATGFAYDFKDKEENNINNFSKFLMASLAVRRAGAASLDLCYVACGRFDGFWELDLKPWDKAAAGLIISEAAGKVTDFKGGQFNIYSSQTLASNGLIHRNMLNILCRNTK
ncbi:MAG: inositol monophosphatase [Candidatus Omnitrophica bacterium]|nr:inositol monophosphatase [Candidatus Omnitrophota bacterium]